MRISSSFIKSVMLILAVCAGLSACTSDDSSANAQLNVERAERQGI